MNNKAIGNNSKLGNALKALALCAVCSSVFASPIYTDSSDVSKDKAEMLKKEQMLIEKYRLEQLNKDDDVVITPMGGCTPTPGCVGYIIK